MLDTTYVSPTGTVIRLSAGGDFQAALNAAQPGNVIELQAGATFTGNFTLPYKTGPGWIYIQSSALSSLPSAGTGVSPAHATLMPKIVTPNSSSALTTAANAHHYRFIGVEITGTLASTSSTQLNLVALGSGTDVVFDRCYVHGTPTGNYNQGIQLNNARTAVIDSYLSDFHSTVQDAQAIVGWNGPGPFKIVNNHLESAGENVMFGGADPSVNNLVPSDIEIRRNHFFKPLSWRVGDPSYAGIHWRVKNLLALKNGRRVLIDGNLFENNWPDAQGGTAILFTVRNQNGTAPWSTVEDVTFTNNIVRHTGSGIGMHGWDDLHPSQQTQRILIRNNLFADVSAATWGGRGWLVSAFKGIVDLAVDHNTGFMDQAIMFAEGGAHTRFVYRNNLTLVGAFGFTGTGTNQGIDALNTYFPAAVFMRNVLAGGNPSLYPAGNFFPASLASVGFVDLAGGNYRLSAASPYKNGGTDGKDIGADLDAIAAAFAGAASVSDTTVPTVSITAPISGATVAGTISVTASATDNVGIRGVQFKLNGANLGAEVTAPPYRVSWSTTSVPNGAHTLRAVARDAAGNGTTSAPVSVTVLNGDLTRPTVAITAPAAGATTTGTVTLRANATDNVGVVGVQFKLDGANIGAEVTAPYAVAWNTTTAANGTHTLTAVARDAAGNATTSAPISVTVSNGAVAKDLSSPVSAPLVTPAAAAGALRSYATIHSIGVEWDVSGDPNHNATVAVEYRVQGSSTWKPALPLIRVDYNGYDMLAGSILFLSPNTTYEVRLTLSDPDGGGEVRTLTIATRPVPALPTGGRTFHVVPGSGGGDGSVANPFRGIGAAQAVAQPRDIFLVHAGSYGGRITFDRAGTAGGNYIVWKGAGDGEALFSGIDIAASYIWLEGLTVRDQTYATFSKGAPTGVVVSRNTFINCHYCIYLQQGGIDWYIADNDISGDIDPACPSCIGGEGIELNGGFTTSYGHVVAHNRITRVADGISAPYYNVDIYGNDIFDVSDDGIEGDRGRANVRMWGNRIQMAHHHAFSFQDQDGAPWYIIRNQLVSFKDNVFKFRTVYRFVLLHNTIVNWGNIMPCCINRDDILKAISKNNLWISVTGGPIWPMDNGTVKDWRTDLNHDGFDWGSYSTPFTYAGVGYPSIVGLAAASGLETNGIRVNKSTCFETFNVPGPVPTSVPAQFMTLKAGCNAIDAGVVLPNINDGFVGLAPDLGAYEFGQPLPIYGPRPVNPTLDLTPPVISAVSASAAPFAATVVWTTDEASDTQVEYGLTTAYGSLAPLNASLVTAHSQTLTGLAAGTLYHYRVRSRDAAGNLGVSGDFTLTTLAAPAADLVAYRPPIPMTVDGTLAEWTGHSAVQLSGISNNATAHVAWDPTNLYVAFQVTDTQLSALQTARDSGNLWQDDSVEIYIDTRGDRGIAMQPDDYQLQVSLNNVQADLRGTGIGKDTTWNATWASAVRLQGTLNSHGDTDNGYTVEIAIPWAQLGVTPAGGMYVGLDLTMNDSDPASAIPFDYFDWAQIAPAPYGQPLLWKWVRLADAPPPLGDTTPPSVAITSPSSGAIVSGTVTVAATASDNVGVVGVQFRLDGAPLGAEVTAPPYTLAWNTTAVANGAHTLSAVARDAAGNTATAAGIGVTVANADTTPPTVTITSPTSNPTFTTTSSPVALGGSASDTVGVTQVTWANSLGGSGIATGTTSWTVTGIVLQPGSNVLTVTARDAAGNTATDTLTVTFNDTTAPTVTITSPTSNPTLAATSSPLTLGGTASDAVGVTQVTWANSRGGSGTATGTISWTASGIGLQPGSNVLTVTARDAAGNTATDTLTVTLTGVFTDDPLMAQSTPIKAVHFTELRAAIDSARVARGLAPFAWADLTLLPGSTQVGVVHLVQLRTALNQAYQAAGRTLPTYTDPIPATGSLIVKTIHLNELRNAVRAL